MANSLTLKAAGLQTYYQSLMEIPPGALLKANNSIINRDGVIESRRGIKAYNSGDFLLPAKAEQLMEYKGRILAHLQNNTLVYDNGSAVFVPFSDGIKEKISITVTSTPTSSSYFVIYSALDQRKYVVWFDRSGTDPEPTVPETFNYIKVEVLGTPLNSEVAIAIRDAITANSNAVSDFSLSLSTDIITITNTAVGITTAAFSSSTPLSNLTVVVTVEGKNNSSYTEPVSGYRMRSAESKGNFYFTTNNGIQRISAKTASELTSSDAVQQSGVPKGIAGVTKVDHAIGGFLTNGQKTGYIIIWRYTDKQGTSMQGAPSATMVAENKSIVTDSSAVRLDFQIPEGINSLNYTSYKFVLFRTDATTLTGTLANEYRQIFERAPTLSEINSTSRNIQHIDTVSESLRIGGEPAYTNTANGSGLLSANERPPAARDISLFNGHMFYANTRTPHSTTFSLLTNTGFSSGNSNLIISNGETTNTYTFQGQKQITQVSIGAVTASTALDEIQNGDYFTLSSAANERKYTVWMDKTTNGAASQVTSVTVGATLPAGATKEVTSVTVSAVPTGSVKEVTTVTVNATLPVASSYFVLYSALDQRQYVIWFDRSGTDLQPTVAGTFAYVRVPVLGTPTTTAVATAIASAITVNLNSDFTATSSLAVVTITNKAFGTTTNTYQSTVPAANLTIATTAQGRESSYFVLNSSLNQRKYVIWFDASGTDLQPTVTGTFAYLRIPMGAAPTTTTVATAIKDTININLGPVYSGAVLVQAGDFTATSSTNIVTITNVAFGATTDASISPAPLTSNLTISTTTQGNTSSYFVLYSALNRRKYVIWFDRSGTDLQPTIADTFGYIRINTGAAPTSATIATAIFTQLLVNASSDFAVTLSGSVVTITNTAAGPTIDATRSEAGTPSIASNLTVTTTAQGTGPLPGTIPLRVYLNPATVTNAVLAASTIETAIRTSLGFDFTTSYTAGSNTFLVTAENNGFCENSEVLMQIPQKKERSTITVNATLPGGSTKEVNSVTVTSIPTASSYFVINSAPAIDPLTNTPAIDPLTGLAESSKQYVIWFDSSSLGDDLQPTVAGTFAYVKVELGISPNTTTVATAIRNAINDNISSHFTATSSTNVVTITNKNFGNVDNIYQSIVPAANLTVTTTTNGTPSSYFIINSAIGRQYVIWFDMSASALEPSLRPTVAGTYAYLKIPYQGAAATAAIIAGAVANAITSNLSSEFTVTYTIGATALTIENTQTGAVPDVSQSIAAAGVAGANLTLAVNTQGNNWLTSITTQSGVGEDLPNRKILISGKLNLVDAIEDMAKSIVRAINYNSSETVIAYYASTLGTTPGKILLQSKNLQDINFFVGTSDSFITPKFSPELGLSIRNTQSASTAGTPLLTTIETISPFNFIQGDTVLIYGASSTITPTAPSLNGKKVVYQTIQPDISTNLYTIQQDSTTIPLPTPPDTEYLAGYVMTSKLMSTAESIANRIYYSKHQQPEAVPVLNYEDVGSKDQEILRIIALRESLYVFKNDGIFKITGEGGPTPFFKASVYDNTAILKAPDTLVNLGNQCYFYGNQGISRLGDSSMESISRPIDDKIIPFLKSNPNLPTVAFAVAYESDKALLLWTVKSKLDTVATVCLRYSTQTQTWTEWEISKKCAVLNSHEDVMYFGSAVDNYIEVERKNFDRFDYADRELVATMGEGALIGNSLYLASAQFALLSVGDVFSQKQYVTVSQFNSLIKQLDLDPLMPSDTFYSELKLSVGEDLNAAMVKLVAKLNIVDTWSGVDPNGNTSYQFVPDYSNYQNVQTQFNKIIDRLNKSPNAHYNNYLYSVGTVTYECFISELEVSTKRIGLSIAPAFMTGPLVIFKGIPVEIQYAPQHGGDPDSFKQFSDASFLFERRSFYSGQAAFNSDISDHFEEIPLFPNSSGVFGGFTWGNGSTWGGLGDQANIRSYIPLKKQRCRFLGCKFIHVTALENFQLYGISLSFRPYTISNRDYK